MRLTSFLFFCAALLTGCQRPADTSSSEAPELSEATLRRHIAALADDSFLGRKPFTEGETKTLDYLISEVQQIGLAPGNGTSYTQDVPLVEIDGQAAPTLELTGPTPISLALGEQYVAYTQRAVEEVRLTASDLVFCGYGIVAPEYNWNDYEGLDMKGKTALILVNDPGLGSEDSTFFKGNTMTYYGRWTYKYAEAARQGAAGVLIVHEATMAGYPWAVVRGSGSGAQLNLENLGYTPCDMQGWMQLDAAKSIFAGAGLDLQEAMMAARKPGFKPIPLPYQVSGEVKNEIRRNVSKNVIAMLPGTTRPEEYILYSAHWDHLGVGATVDGDSIYNGAIDNASGSAALLTIAEAMKKSGDNERSVVFLWLTAEEQGLLGAAYYTENPIFPTAQTVANLNIDGMNDYGLMKDFSIVGFGQSEMQEYATKWAKTQDRYIMADPEPEKGYFFRSDHFHFARVGIPALYGEGNFEHATDGKEKIRELSDAYRRERYHLPSDAYTGDDFQVSGMLQDASLFYLIGKDLANNQDWPAWYAGSEFKAARDADRK